MISDVMIHHNIEMFPNAPMRITDVNDIIRDIELVLFSSQLTVLIRYNSNSKLS